MDRFEIDSGNRLTNGVAAMSEWEKGKRNQIWI